MRPVRKCLPAQSHSISSLLSAHTVRCLHVCTNFQDQDVYVVKRCICAVYRMLHLLLNPVSCLELSLHLEHFKVFYIKENVSPCPKGQQLLSV